MNGLPFWQAESAVGRAICDLWYNAVRARADLEAKARLLPFAEKYRRIETELFVAQNPPPGTVSIDWCGD